jgi:REP element-mobilizing transposase RayT
MAAPPRGNTGLGTYFITADSFQKHSLFQSTRMADLLVKVLLGYRAQEKYLLHEFVLMPDHFHLLITPTLTLERALQLIKGGFSFRAKRDLAFGAVRGPLLEKRERWRTRPAVLPILGDSDIGVFHGAFLQCPAPGSA